MTRWQQCFLRFASDHLILRPEGGECFEAASTCDIQTGCAVYRTKWWIETEQLWKAYGKHMDSKATRIDKMLKPSSCSSAGLHVKVWSWRPRTVTCRSSKSSFLPQSSMGYQGSRIFRLGVQFLSQTGNPSVHYVTANSCCKYIVFIPALQLCQCWSRLRVELHHFDVDNAQKIKKNKIAREI